MTFESSFGTTADRVTIQASASLASYSIPYVLGLGGHFLHYFQKARPNIPRNTTLPPGTPVFSPMCDVQNV